MNVSSLHDPVTDEPRGDEMLKLEIERRKRGWSQADLGERLLYTGAHISQLELGRIPIDRINRRFRHALELALGLSLEELLTEVE